MKTAFLNFLSRINPILIRDLRKLVRSRLFMVLFLGIQGVLLIFLFANTAEAASVGGSSASGEFLWLTLNVYLWLVLPFLSLNAVADERKEGRFELVLLTRLTARKIVWGKWLALVIMGGIVSSTLLPYLTMRYYLGRVDILMELQRLLYCYCGSALLISIGVALSAYLNRVTKILFYIFGIYGFMAFIGAMFSAIMYGRGSGAVGGYIGSWQSYATMVLMVAPLIALALEFAAARMHAQVENNQTPIRLIGLYFLLLILLVCHFKSLLGVSDSSARFLMIIEVAMASLISLGCWMHRPLMIPMAYKPFIRFGRIGRFVGRYLLYPGWPSGIFYSLVALLLWVGSIMSFRGFASDNLGFLIGSAAFWNSILLPAAMPILFPTRWTSSALYYPVTQIILWCVGIMILILSLSYSDAFGVLNYFPTATLLLGFDGNHFNVETAAIVNATLFTLVWIGLYTRRYKLAPLYIECELAAAKLVKSR